MVNYVCAFSQSVSGKYFGWIITINNKLQMNHVASGSRPTRILPSNYPSHLPSHSSYQISASNSCPINFARASGPRLKKNFSNDFNRKNDKAYFQFFLFNLCYKNHPLFNLCYFFILISIIYDKKHNSLFNFCYVLKKYFFQAFITIILTTWIN